jgi:outer membrane receptor protein involved in Fe transport
VQGQVIDGEADVPLEGATVALWQEADGDSTLVTGTTTGPEGRFTIEADAQSYTLRLSYVGYTDRRIEGVTPAAGGNDLGTLVLTPETAQVDEVEVTADRPAARMETDRTVYNTRARALSAGGSAESVLSNLPSIRVDTDGSISYRGNESVSIYINGDPASLSGESLLSYLRSLPADAIQQIEIIPNPSARYEPEGTAGIINVVLRRDVNAGWGGGFTLGGEGNANARYGGSGSANVSYQAGGWRLVSTYSHDREGEEDTDTRFVRRFNGGAANTEITQDGLEEETERSHSFDTQLDYSPTENTTVGLETTLSIRRDEESGRNDTYWTGAVDSTNARLADNSSGDETIDGRLSVDHDFSEEHTLETELSYDRDFESSDATYTNRVLTNGTVGPVRSTETETVNEDEQDGSLEIDYTRPLGSLALDAGYKGTYRRLDSDQAYEEPNADVPEIRDFTFDEQIHAVYGILSRELGDFSVETGLRAETVHTNVNPVNDPAVESSYTSLYPSVFFTYSPNQRRQGRLSYSKRVDRPGLWDINPIEDNENPSFVERGNPTLDPEYIHSFELTGTQRWDGASVTVTPYVRYTVNEIEEVEFEEQVDGQTVTVRQARNLSSSTSYGTELITTFSVGERLEGTLSGNFYRSVTDGSNLTTDLSNNALTFSGYADIRAQLRDGLNFEISQYYRPAQNIPGGRMDRITSTEMALQQQLFSGDGSLTLRVDDVFNATNFNVWRETENFYQETTSQWGARSASITFQYTFGSSEGGGDDRRRRR